MVCIYCANKTAVINSRRQKRSNKIWRRRQCLKCKAVFTTSESVDLDKSLVIKSDSQYKPLKRDKLFVSVYDSLRHRKTALNDATALTDTIINRLYAKHSAQIEKADVIKISSEVLKKFDKAGYVYYSAYHSIKAK